MAMMKTRRSSSWLLLITGTAFCAFPASAQEAPATPATAGAADGAISPDIIITARRRQERLIDVPQSVTAITGAEIAARGVESLNEMQYTVPGLTLVEFGPGAERAQLRGISSSIGLPTIGRYLDEVPINPDGFGGFDVRLLDMDRIEVLRGPQPTLYGEGSMGGTIRYITAAPNLREFAGRAEAELGLIEHGGTSYRGAAVINAPLVTDQLGLRLVAGYDRQAGWIDSQVTGRDDVNGVTFLTLRGTLLFRPTDRLSISLLGLHQKQDQNYLNYGALNRTTNTRYPTRNDDRYDLGNLVISYDLGPATLLSSTGFLDRNVTNAFDLSGALVPFLALFGFPPGYVDTIGLVGDVDHRMWSEEGRITSNGTGRLSYTFGGYYRDYQTSGTIASPTSPGVLPFALIAADNFIHSKSWAVFGELGYRLTDRLEVLVGGRYFKDTRAQVGTTTNFGVTSLDDNHATFDTFNPRVNVSYRTDHGRIYFNAARGFRSGGFNLESAGLGVFPVPPTYAPESLWSYELGTRQEMLDRRLTVEAAVYYNDWGNVQSQVFAPGSPITIIANGGAASGFGADFSFTLRPTNTLSLSGTIGYTDMNYDTNTLERLKGDPLDFVAKWTYSAAIDYRRPIGGRRALIGHADYQHSSSFPIIARNAAPPTPPVVRSDPRDIVNLRVGVNFGGFEAYLFADNALDNNSILLPTAGAAVGGEPVLPRPRTLGIALKAGF